MVSITIELEVQQKNFGIRKIAPEKIKPSRDWRAHRNRSKRT